MPPSAVFLLSAPAYALVAVGVVDLFLDELTYVVRELFFGTHVQ